MDVDSTLLTGMIHMQLLVTLVVAGGWWALYRPLLTQAHYRWWAWGWTAFFVFLLGARISVALPPESTGTVFLQAPAGLVQVACFVLGAEALRRGEEVSRPWRRGAIALAVVLGLAVAVIQLPLEDERVSIAMGTLARSPGLGLALVYCGWMFFFHEGNRSGVATWATSVGFVLYGVDQLVYSVAGFSEVLALATDARIAGLGIEVVLSDAFFLADMAWQASIGLGAILLMVEEKDRLVRVSRKRHRQFRALFDHSADGILVTDEDGRIEAANPAAAEMLAAGDAAVEGRSVADLFADAGGDVPPDPSELDEGEGLTVEATCRTFSGADFPVELTLSAYELEGRTRVQILMRDVSTRKALMDQLKHKATHHPLTDLPNRAYLDEQLERMLAMMNRGEARPAVLFLDLDQFKSVNDTFGHSVGDQLLVAVADRLRDTVRDTELLGHIGGDEFVVLVPWCRSHDVLERIGRRVACSLSGTYHAGDHDVGITVSVGGATARSSDRADDLIRRADRAMYRAKDRAETESAGVHVTAGA